MTPAAAFPGTIAASGRVSSGGGKRLGSSSLSVQGRKFKRQHPRSKQLDACSAIHSPLERL